MTMTIMENALLTEEKLQVMKVGALKIWLAEHQNQLSADELSLLAQRLLADERSSVAALGAKIDKAIKQDAKEMERLRALYSYERDLWQKGYKLVAGIDEAGRGPLVGPVVTAAVVFKEETLILGLDDSKKLSEAKREALYDEIMEKALAVAVGIADHEVIDQINILNATKQAMIDAVRDLSIQPDFLLLDAVKLDALKIEQLSLIKGDQKSASIAAASIIAKVTRDRLMAEVDREYPQYGFSRHKGYGTPEHVTALRAHGPCPYHRWSFIKNLIEG